MVALPAVLLLLKFRVPSLVMLALPAVLLSSKNTRAAGVVDNGDAAAVDADASAIKTEEDVVGEGVGRGPGVECPAADVWWRPRTTGSVMLDAPKDAVPIGTVAGVQLAAVLKSPVPGVGSQVASCARAETAAAINAEEASSVARRLPQAASAGPADEWSCSAVPVRRQRDTNLVRVGPPPTRRAE